MDLQKLQSDELLPGRVAVKLLPGTTYDTLMRWAREGKVPVYLLGGRKFFRREDVEALLTPVVGSAASADDGSCSFSGVGRGD